MTTRRITGFVAILGAAVVLAGCGGSSSSSSTTTSSSSSSSVSTADWANNLCTAFTSWTTSVRSAGSSLKGNMSQKSVENAANQMRDATDKLKSDLKGLGQPNTAAGKKAKETIDTLAGQLQTDVDKIDKAVKDVTNGKGVLPAVSSVSTTLQDLGTHVRTAFNELQSLDTKGELEKAFKSSDACKKLSGQTS